jgi:hypothetical protein
MEVIREEFQKILESLKLGVGSGADVGLEGIAFTGDNLVSFNKIVSVSFPFKSSFSCLISYEKLNSIVKELKGEKLDMVLKESQLRIESSNGKAGITKIEDSQVWDFIKSLNLHLIKKWGKLPSSFLSGLELCLFSVGKDFSSGPLSCIFIDGSNLYSSDNLRISYFSMGEEIGGKYLVPGNAISSLIKFPVIDFSVNNSWIHFRTKEKAIFSLRLFEGSFPDCKGAFKDFFSIKKGIKVDLPQDLKELLPSLVIFREDGVTDMDMKASFQFKSGTLTCRSECSSGWIERKVKKIKYTGKDFSFLINPLFLRQIIELSPTMLLEESGSRALFTSKNFHHLIALPVE